MEYFVDRTINYATGVFVYLSVGFILSTKEMVNTSVTPQLVWHVYGRA